MERDPSNTSIVKMWNTRSEYLSQCTTAKLLDTPREYSLILKGWEGSWGKIVGGTKHDTLRVGPWKNYTRFCAKEAVPQNVAHCTAASSTIAGTMYGGRGKKRQLSHLSSWNKWILTYKEKIFSYKSPMWYVGITFFVYN